MDKLDHLLQRTSRTFALSIPELPEPLRYEVGISYLLFRLLDTVEDEGRASNSQRVHCIRSIINEDGHRWFSDLPHFLHEWSETAPPDDPGYAELLTESGWVAAQLDALPAGPRDAICRHFVRTGVGMIERLEAAPPLETVEAVCRYCYHVAGIVGELCTELFVLHDPQLAKASDALMQNAARFGEALQLVNLLRDHRADIDCGRDLIACGTVYEALFDRAAASVQVARAYIGRLEEAGASEGIIRFNRVNLALAEATLPLIRRQGPGVKLSRDVVHAVITEARAPKLAGGIKSATISPVN